MAKKYGPDGEPSWKSGRYDDGSKMGGKEWHFQAHKAGQDGKALGDPEMVKAAEKAQKKAVQRDGGSYLIVLFCLGAAVGAIGQAAGGGIATLRRR